MYLPSLSSLNKVRVKLIVRFVPSVIALCSPTGHIECIRVQFLLVIFPNVVLVDGTLFHELHQRYEVDRHVRDCPVLIRSQLSVERLNQKRVSLTHFPEILLLSHSYHLYVCLVT